VKANAELACEKLPELLSIAVDRDMYGTADEWAQACRIVNQSIQTALQMQVRADETSLRAKHFDRLEELLIILAEEERSRPMKVVNAVPLALAQQRSSDREPSPS
jgi:hypothetical protein